MHEIPSEFPTDPIQFDRLEDSPEVSSDKNECPDALQAQADEYVQVLTDDPEEVFDVGKPADLGADPIAPIVVPGLTDDRGGLLKSEGSGPEAQEPEGERLIDEAVPQEPRMSTVEVEGHPKLLVVDRTTPESGPSPDEHIKAFTSTFSTSTYEGETPMSKKEKRIVQQGSQLLSEVAEEVGVDVSHRMPGPEAYHFFDTQEQLSKVMPEGSGPQSAYVNLQQGIMVSRENIVAREEFIITHELSHALHLIVADVGPASDIQYTPHMEREVCAGFNEYITDVTARRALERVSKESHAGSSLYVLNNRLGDEVVAEAAQQHGMHPPELQRMLLRDAFTGETEGLQCLEAGLGDDRWSALKQMPLTLSGMSYYDLRRKLRLDK